MLDGMEKREFPSFALALERRVLGSK